MEQEKEKKKSKGERKERKNQFQDSGLAVAVCSQQISAIVRSRLKDLELQGLDPPSRFQ